MFKRLLTYAASGYLDLDAYNNYMDLAADSVDGLYANTLSLGKQLNEIVNFKRDQISFYNSKIEEVIDSFNESSSNRYQQAYSLPLNHQHFFNLGKSNADIDTDEEAIKINDTEYGYRLPVEKYGIADEITYYVEEKAKVDSNFLEYGCTTSDLLSDYYNYFRYVVRATAQGTYTFVVDIPMLGVEVSSLRLYLDNVEAYMDNIEVLYRAPASTTFVSKYASTIRSPKEEIFVGEKADIIRIKITKHTYDKLTFENNRVFFDYYFTIRKIDFYKKKYYHQNIFTTKPMAFGAPDVGLMRNHVRVHMEATMPNHTNVRLFYGGIKRGVFGNVISPRQDELVAVKSGDEIELVPYEKTLLTDSSTIYKSYNENYVVLTTPVDVTQILNGGINVFRATNKYHTIGSAGDTFQFWIIYTERTPLEIVYSDYCDKLYLNSGLCTGDAVTINRGFYKVVTVSSDVDAFITYMKSLSTKLSIAGEKFVFGLPSEILTTNYTQAFTLLLRADKKLADIAVSMPIESELSEKYTIVYDTRRQS